MVKEVRHIYWQIIYNFDVWKTAGCLLLILLPSQTQKAQTVFSDSILAEHGKWFYLDLRTILQKLIVVLESGITLMGIALIVLLIFINLDQILWSSGNISQDTAFFWSGLVVDLNTKKQMKIHEVMDVAGCLK